MWMVPLEYTEELRRHKTRPGLCFFIFLLLLLVFHNQDSTISSILLKVLWEILWLCFCSLLKESEWSHQNASDQYKKWLKFSVMFEWSWQQREVPEDWEMANVSHTLKKKKKGRRQRTTCLSASTWSLGANNHGNHFHEEREDDHGYLTWVHKEEVLADHLTTFYNEVTLLVDEDIRET